MQHFLPLPWLMHICNNLIMEVGVVELKTECLLILHNIFYWTSPYIFTVFLIKSDCY